MMQNVLVIGGGPAGIATSRELHRRGIDHLVLERGDCAGFNWTRLYDSLTLHTGKHLSYLPGLRFPATTPLFPTRSHFVDYLHAYATRFAVPVRTGVHVTDIAYTGDGWRVQSESETFLARTLVVATGIMSNPVRPAFDDIEQYEGSVIHSIEYRRPDSFLRGRVLVVGVGNSGGEIASELARAGVDTTISVRSGANVVPLTIAGVPVQYIAFLLRELPAAVRERILARVRTRTEKRRGPSPLPPRPGSPLDAIPLIGFKLIDEINAGRIAVRPGIARFTRSGVQFTDGRQETFDDVILATGFRPALQPFHARLSLDAKGFARRSDRVTSSDFPNLLFVGHNYDTTGGLANIRRDSKIAAARIHSMNRHGRRDLDRSPPEVSHVFP